MKIKICEKKGAVTVLSTYAWSYTLIVNRKFGFILTFTIDRIALPYTMYYICMYIVPTQRAANFDGKS